MKTRQHANMKTRQHTSNMSKDKDIIEATTTDADKVTVNDANNSVWGGTNITTARPTNRLFHDENRPKSR
jgi:hypothetical protein